MKYNKEFRQELVGLYKIGWHCNKIGEKYGIHRRTIKRLLNQEGIQLVHSQFWTRKYTIDENFFEKIDTKEKAYLLGWVLSDGGVNNERCALLVNLQIRDKEILELFNKLLKSNRPIVTQKKRNPKWQDTCYCSFSNKKILTDLKQYGCVQNKSMNLAFPTGIPEELMSHFIRGYFDGDGCLSVQKEKYPSCSIICAESFAITLKEKLSQLNIDSAIDNNKKMKNVRIRRISGIYKFLKWIYADSEGIRLSRKYDKTMTLYEARKSMSKRSTPLCQ